VAISEFTTQHQTLLEQNNALEATLEASPEKSVFDEATLTGSWKLPVIKGLNYQCLMLSSKLANCHIMLLRLPKAFKASYCLFKLLVSLPRGSQCDRFNCD
jgi:hypothetical protein